MSYLIRNARIVNEGKNFEGDLLIKNGIIEKVDTSLNPNFKVTEILAEGKYLIPGVIDDQVHFREPGLTHKAEIATESIAAVIGGTTSFMEMPNTSPPATTAKLLEEKYAIASACSPANYSFYFGASNENIEETLRISTENVCGLKVFMGSSTGNMLVDDSKTLEAIFSKWPGLIATHCEDEAIIRANTEKAIRDYREDIPFHMHPEIRSVDACLKSSSKAVELAKKWGARLHVLHISTEDETFLFDNSLALEKKRITAEACVHHLWFDSSYYEESGARIKCNPAIKSKKHQQGVWAALKSGRIDVVATDHAPHTIEEKENPYLSAPSGLPLVQHSLLMMLEYVDKGEISIEQLVQWMSHNPAIAFRLKDRGFIKEGFAADLVLVDSMHKTMVKKNSLHYKCNWSPLEGYTFSNSIDKVFVNGNLIVENGRLVSAAKGARLLFEKER
ncbi:MAG: dihydroorotase [Chitinophagaceae bacterium]|nr:MAG: dihydroorotase [Chitinophagaceae bacterium]